MSPSGQLWVKILPVLVLVGTPIISGAVTWGAVTASLKNAEMRLVRVESHVDNLDVHSSRRDWDGLEKRLTRIEEKLDRVMEAR